MNNENKNINDDLLILYLLNEASTEEEKKVEHWLNLSDDNKKYFQQFKKLWFESGNLKPKPVAVDVQKAWQKVDKKLKTKSVKFKKRNNFIKTALKIAAVIIIIFGIFMLYKTINTQNKQIILASTDSLLTDTLSDGSIITLNENTEISYPKNYNKNDKRIVKLEGEAFFEVKPDKEKPFIVDLGKAYVEVLGTKFNVNTKKDSNFIYVYVKKGQVRLSNYKPKSQDSIFIILKTNEKGKINKKTGIPEKIADTLNNSNQLYWKTNTLKFNSCNLSDVAIVLEKTFNIDIEVSQKAKKLKLTATFKDETLNQILQIIELTFNLNIKKENQKVYINVAKE